jgi:hypothetical protein
MIHDHRLGRKTVGTVQKEKEEPAARYDGFSRGSTHACCEAPPIRPLHWGRGFGPAPRDLLRRKRSRLLTNKPFTLGKLP